jgi:CubicO group peptidase (beta-lactamase class C family)
MGCPADAPAVALAALEARLDAAIADWTFPGAAVAFGGVGEAPVVRCRGRIGYAPEAPPVRRTTLYDLASMTKPVSTAPIVLRRAAQGRLDLDEPIAVSLPAFGRCGKGSVTWRHALLHAAALAPTPTFDRLRGASRADVVEAILRQPLRAEPGTRAEYSCDGYVAMGLALEAREGRTLDDLSRELMGVLGLPTARYRPGSGAAPAEVAPTEVVHPVYGAKGAGEVDDPISRALGGVSGNAGVFASLDDVVALARAWLRDPAAPGVVPLPPDLFEAATRPADPARTDTRALVWDTRSPKGYTLAGTTLGTRSFGHSGNTGTSVWMDPDAGFYVVLLTNAVHPVRDARRGYVWLRPEITDLAWRAWRARGGGGGDRPEPGARDGPRRENR